MKKKSLFTATILAGGLMLGACNITKKGNEATKDATEQVATKALSIDDLLAKAEGLANKEVTIEGLCTHICQHGGRKIFLMGTDDTKTIRVENGKNEAFKEDCVNSMVTVKGTLMEQRINEEYLKNWEQQIKDQTAEQHGTEEEGGCSTEKKARGETANTVEGRIADFRKKIVERKAKTGKDYLSFYYIKSVEYEIND